MSTQSPSPRVRSAREVQEHLAAQRSGCAFLVYRDASGAQRIQLLDVASGKLIIGRQPSSGLRVDWDPEVSRVHAIIERVGDEWTLVDDGRSLNGTQLNGRRTHGRQRLRDGDVLAIGKTAILFVDPSADDVDAEQTLPRPEATGPRLSEAQRRVLTALCRPYASDAFAIPASNRAIAEELVIGVETVKTHMRDLFQLFGVGDLPQNRKRAELVRQALERGLVVLPPSR